MELAVSTCGLSDGSTLVQPAVSAATKENNTGARFTVDVSSLNHIHTFVPAGNRHEWRGATSASKGRYLVDNAQLLWHQWAKVVILLTIAFIMRHSLLYVQRDEITEGG